jgi:hypothetical protein
MLKCGGTEPPGISKGPFRMDCRVKPGNDGKSFSRRDPRPSFANHHAKGTKRPSNPKRAIKTCFAADLRKKFS